MAFPDATARVEPLLVVADLTRSVGWWTEVVGADVVHQQGQYALLELGGGRLHLAQAGDAPADRDVATVTPPGRRDATSTMVVIEVDDCQRVVSVLKDRGVTLLGPARTPPWGGDEVRAFLESRRASGRVQLRGGG